MAAPDLTDLFGDSSDDDDFTPAERNQPAQRQQDEGDDDGEGGEQQAAEDTELQAQDSEQPVDDGLDFRDAPQPHQPSQLREYSDEDDDEDGLVQTVQERPVGPPAEMSGALLPHPGIGNLRLLQTSKFSGIQTLPMTPENLKLERDGVVMDEATGEAKDYSYKRQMTIRWRERKLPDGTVKIESNARIVKWSNGTTQMLLGDEVLDVTELDNNGANQFIYVRHSHPVAFIQGLGQLTTKVQLRPSSLSSKFHKQLTAEATKKHTRVNRVKSTATVVDPNKAKAEREKAEEERIRSRENLQKRQDREMRKYPAPVSRREYRPAGITSQFLETIEDEPEYSDDEDMTATERARSALQRPSRDENDEREAELQLARAKQSQGGWREPKSNKRPAEDTDNIAASQEFRVDDDGEEEEDIGKKPASKKRRRGGLVLSDDSDED